ncbi:MAG: GNAT family N-acetyltransferase [Ginsengibacter sp.]
MKIEILKLQHNDIDDFSNLIKIFEKIFEWQNILFPSKTHLQKVIDNPRFIAFVAKAHNKLIGGLTAHILDRYDTEKPSAYIYDIAVLTDFQRKGIGKLLIAGLSDYCEKNGFSEVFVQAETGDIEAVNFYRTTPISSELKATHFTYSFENEK